MNTVNTNIATVTDITSFVKSATPMPEINTQAIDTSNICLLDYRADDADIASVVNDFGWQSIKLVNEAGEVVPNARLQLTFKSGKSVKIIPFFPLVLLAKQATLKLNTETLMTQWAELKSMKSRNSYKFEITKEQLDALTAKTEMNYEATIQQTVNSFVAWLGDYKPAIAALPTLFAAYQVKATLVVLGEHIYIRQVILASDKETQPLSDAYLVQANKPTNDKIGDVVISTAYTYRLEVPSTEEQAA